MSHLRCASAPLPVASGADVSQQDSWAKRYFYACRGRVDKSEEVSREMRAVRSILFPREYHRTGIRVDGPVEEYLIACYQNILAEYWNMVQNFHTKIRNKDSYYQIQGIRQFEEGSWYFDDVFKVTQEPDEDQDPEPFLTEDNISYLAVFRGHLCMTIRRGNNFGLIAGVQVEKLNCQYQQEFRGRASDNCMCMLGYVKVFIHDLLAILDMMDSAAAQPKILDAIANPKSIRSFDYASFNPRSLKGNIPCNKEQKEIVINLKNEIEGIQGPPGTGKSTTIFHIIRTRLPVGTLALVTSVQNKAVESIAEKLKSNIKETPFFVFGQERNLGKVSVEFLLERQVERDSKVVEAAQELKRLQEIERLFSRNFEKLRNRRFREAHDTFRNKMWKQRCARKARQQAKMMSGGFQLVKSKKDEGRQDQGTKEDEGRARFDMDDPWKKWWFAFCVQRYQVLLKEQEQWSKAKEKQECKLERLRLEVHDNLIANAKAILCTVDMVHAIPAKLKHLFDFFPTFRSKIAVAIIDEAGSIPEYKMPMIASIGVSSARGKVVSKIAIVVIGDHKQLPPFSLLKDRGDGFFHRLLRSAGPFPMLTTQYRMESSIAAFISSTFYGRKLITDPTASRQRRDAWGLRGILWIDYADSTAEVGVGDSQGNPKECEIICSILAQSRGVLESRTVMVIAFYTHQLALLNAAIETIGLTDCPNLRVVTVDSSQGSEADIVILSCVRCNTTGDVGFLKDRRRMCVATSRARDLMIVVGSVRTLCCDYFCIGAPMAAVCPAAGYSRNLWTTLLAAATVVQYECNSEIATNSGRVSPWSEMFGNAGRNFVAALLPSKAAADRKSIQTMTSEPLLAQVNDLPAFSVPLPKQESYSASGHIILGLREHITTGTPVTSASVNQENYAVCGFGSVASYSDQTQLMAKTIRSPTTFMSEYNPALPFPVVTNFTCNEYSQADSPLALSCAPPLGPIGVQVPLRVPLAAWSVHDVQRLLGRCGFAEAANAALDCGLDGKTLLDLLCSDNGKLMLALPVRDGGLGLMGMRLWRVVSELRGAEAVP